MPADSRIARVVELCGDLEDDSFYRWWQSTGKNVFVEAKRPLAVKRLDLNNLQEHLFREQALYLEIPLTIRKETILKQVKRYLDQCHEGRDLNLAETSQAIFRLHTKRYRLRVLETGYWVLLYRLLYPEIQAWRIGDRLQIAPHQQVREQDRMTNPKPFEMLNSLTGRYLYKAKYTLLNAERDSFPNTSKIVVDGDYAPFGSEHQAEFLATTTGTDTKPSEWNTWLSSHFAATLRFEIIRRNHIEDATRLPGSKTRLRLPAFIAGTSDLLA